ncbi:MAG: dipeptide/oligopeptide/nickel ABC transporter permease/ATP-binding protein [Frankia sp.]|nr:dipeptide/oligopeptide/nickel ABC transporter permease/ATP-binding protein [Frankia sp.]
MTVDVSSPTTGDGEDTRLAGGQGRFGRAFLRLRRNPLALAAFGYLVIVGLAAALAPVITPYDYAEPAGPPLAPPSGDHWLGTDGLGRDVFTRLVYAGRVSLQISLSVVALAVLISVPLGLLAGYRGGRVDYVMMRICDAFASFPALILMLAVAGILGPEPRNTVIALLVVVLPGLVRIIRGQARAVRAETFVEASRSIGTPDWWIMARRVLPSVASPVIVQATVLLGTAILAEAGLSYLGLGTRLPKPSWGNMLREAYDTTLFSEPLLAVFPGVAIALTVLAFNTLGDGLRDAFGIANDGPKGRSQRRGITTVKVADRPPAPARAASPGPGAAAAASTPDSRDLLRVEGLRVEFDSGRGPVTVLEDLDLTIRQGEVLGLVGESGCGKSVTALAINRLLPSPPGQITAGRILLDGVDLLGLSLRQMRRVRGREISMIFQDPMTSLDPAFTVGHHLVEAQRNHASVDRATARRRAIELLDLVGIPAAARRMGQFPHELSGGMRQRVMIAAALANNPRLLIADEPTTALDVTVQAQILELLRSLQQDLGMAMLFVTHDLGVIADIADRVVVMYAGQVVEEAGVHDLFARPRHPYTRGLLRAMPSRLTPPGERLAIIPGTVPLPQAFPSGCRFASRCDHATADCARQPVPLLVGADGARVRCLLADPSADANGVAAAPLAGQPRLPGGEPFQPRAPRLTEEVR